MRSATLIACLVSTLAAVVVIPALLRSNSAVPTSAAVQERPRHELDAPETPEGPAPCLATYERYQKLKQGQSRNAVKRIMGCEGEMISSQRIGSDTYRTFRYEGANAGSGILAMFSNNFLNGFYQNGLK